MEHLPDHLVLDILSRLTDSSDLARARTVCKTLNSLSNQTTSISLLCTLPRYLKSRSPVTSSSITPFKTIVKNLIFNSLKLESISIGVDKQISVAYDDVDDDSEDDLHLTDVGFVREWLPRVCDGLRALKISDFWVQSCWRRSDVLGVITSCCHSLLELELRNAWLSVDGLSQLPNLTSLTLEFIRLDDEDLNKINTCFPCLEVLNLCGVGGLKEPKIHLLHLTTCQWTVSNIPLSVTIVAPNLISLRLKCMKPRSLVLETPLLSDLSFSVVQAPCLQLENIVNLRSLQLSSHNLSNVIEVFTSKMVQKLTINSEWEDSEYNTIKKSSLENLFKCYPNLSSFTVGPGAWYAFDDWFRTEGWQSKLKMDKLREITACVVGSDIDGALLIISSILERCVILSDMTILMNENANPNLLKGLMLRCTMEWPSVKWIWGSWKETARDALFLEGWDIVWQTPGCMNVEGITQFFV